MRKTLAVLFIMVFLLSLGGFSAHAQAQVQANSFGYLPLVSPGGDSSVPLEFRARQAFDRLAPRLLQAQASGQIVQFEPEFDHALLKVEYQSGFNLATALSVSPQTAPPVFADPKSVLDYIGVGLTRSRARMGPAQSDPVLYLGVYNSCFSAEDFAANNVYQAYLRDASGRLLSVRHGQFDSSGAFDDCFSGGLWQDIIPGYTFTLEIYDSGGVILHNTLFTVIPRLNINSITPKTKTFKGIGPANDTVFIHIFHPYLDDSDDMDAYGAVADTSSKGAWSVKLDPSDELRPGDEVDVIWPMTVTASNPFMFYRYLFVPYIDCQLAGNYCSAYGLPGKSAKLTLTHAKKSYKTSGMFDYYGWYGGNFYDANTDPVFMTAGDKVTSSGAPTLYLPNLTAVPDTIADTISGVAPASLWFEVDLDAFFHATGWKSDNRWIGSDTGGLYTADFSSSFAIDTADIIEASVYFVDPNTGNETDYWNFVVP